MPRKRISYADHAWLRMDDPNNLMVITGLMTFDEPLDYARLKSLVENKLLRFQPLPPAPGEFEESPAGDRIG